MNVKIKSIKFGLLIISLYNFSVIAAPQVVVTIKPIHALTIEVMEGIGKPHLLLQGTESPHNYNLRPSQVKKIFAADLVVWIGPSVEAFLEKIVYSLPNNNLSLLDIKNLTLLKMRHASHDNHDFSHIDPHIWLNPQNAKIIVKVIADRLSKLDPDNKIHYSNNSDKLIKKLEQFDQILTQQLNPIKDIPYIVFHDAFQYFEEHYNLSVADSIYIVPDSRLSVRRLSKLRKRLKSVRCLFTEPQFEPIQGLTENISVKQGVLDPLGTTLPNSNYFTLLQNLADSLNECLGQK